MVVKTPLALKYLYTRRLQITEQMSRLIDVSDLARMFFSEVNPINSAIKQEP